MADAAAGAAVPSSGEKEDAATKATREELKHTAISEKQQQEQELASSQESSVKNGAAEQRAVTPDHPSLSLDGKLRDASREPISSPKKKRAHDQVDKDEDDEGTSRSKKADEQQQQQSKDGSTADAGSETGGAADGGDVSSSNRVDRAEPEKKRLRDEQESGEASTENGSAKDDKATSTTAAPDSTSAFASSGFAKLTSTASPFGTLGGSAAGGAKPSLFGSSSTSSASPFGALSSSNATATAPAPAPAASAPAPAAPKLSFGGAATGSPFASLQGSSGNKLFGSAFGSAAPAATSKSAFGSSSGATGSSVFGSAFGSGAPRLSSFAKPGEAFKSGKKAKPFGAPESEAEESGDDEGASGTGGDDDEKDDEADGGDDGASEATKAGGEEKKKPKLQKVTVDDGEAGEATILQVRARLYYVDREERGWKERGAGMLKINVPERCVEFDRDGGVIPASFDASTLGDDDGVEAAAAAAAKGSAPSSGTGLAPLPKRSVVRLIMRQDSTLRVILNTVVLAATGFKEQQTLKATTVLFTAFEGPDAQPVSIQVKMNVANAKTFLSTMEGIQKELRGD